MPKKKKAGKNKKNSNSTVEKRILVEADPDGQVYGIIEKALGNRFFNINCLDNVKRRCKVRKKRMKVKEGDYVIVALRDFDDKNADIVYRYDSEEVRKLQKDGSIPGSEVFGINKDDMYVEEDTGFDFDEI
jgi:translation initiation factor 1A